MGGATTQQQEDGMLSVENNELITRVGRGAPMGDLMRRYWMPVVPANDIAADGDPQRVRLLGEDLILFRATDGRLGLVPEACPHRGVSLFFGRNEENGLRCVYHGWKYDVSGRCVDMPSEPEESNFKNKIPAQGYAVREHGGVVWAYMGGGDPPGLPEFEWTMVPEDQRNLSHRPAPLQLAPGARGRHRHEPSLLPARTVEPRRPLRRRRVAQRQAPAPRNRPDGLRRRLRREPGREPDDDVLGA